MKLEEQRITMSAEIRKMHEEILKLHLSLAQLAITFHERIEMLETISTVLDSKININSELLKKTFRDASQD